MNLLSELWNLEEGLRGTCELVVGQEEVQAAWGSLRLTGVRSRGSTGRTELLTCGVCPNLE